MTIKKWKWPFLAQNNVYMVIASSLCFRHVCGSCTLLVTESESHCYMQILHQVTVSAELNNKAFCQLLEIKLIPSVNKMIARNENSKNPGRMVVLWIQYGCSLIDRWTPGCMNLFYVMYELLPYSEITSSVTWCSGIEYRGRPDHWLCTLAEPLHQKLICWKINSRVPTYYELNRGNWNIGIRKLA